MLYKQDYKVVINWDINGNMYLEYFKKGTPIIPTKEEKEFVLSNIEALK